VSLGALSFLIFLWPFFLQANPCGALNPCAEYLVKFSSQASPEKIGAVIRRENLFQVAYFEHSQIYHLVGDPSQSKKKVLQRLKEDEAVEYAEPNYPIQAQNLPNDPMFSELWALRNTGQSSGVVGVDLGMEEVWNILTGVPQMIVAILDTGIDYRHEDLAANIWVNTREIPGNNRDDDGDGLIDDYYGYDFNGERGDPMDVSFHGTHIAGTIGAVGNNGIGITGINWRVKLMGLKVLDSAGNGSLSDIVRGIEYAVDHGAKVINASWAFPSSLSGLPSDPSLEPSQAMRDAIAAADQAGVIFVAAAGNHGVNSDQLPRYPASYSLRNIISVAATDRNDVLASFSNYGALSIDLGAPGVSILSTYPNDPNRLYAYATGTSMASPHVAGAAALLWAQNPSLSHREVIDRILQGVQHVSSLNGKTLTGGRLDLARSISLNSTQVNHPPVANAGSNQFKTLGQTVNLNGSAVDADGDALSFEWTLTVPAGSHAVLNTHTSPQASFTPDVIGTYRASLVASDAASSSLPSSITIQVTSTSNGTPPTISIQIKRNGVPTSSTQINVGDLIALDASASRASGGQALTYRWAFTERPAGSTALLNNANSAIASFRADKTGRYSVNLSVSAGSLSSSSEIVFWSNPASTLQPPSISIRMKRNGVSMGSTQVSVNDLITLDGSACNPNGPYSLSFLWSFILKPAGSTAVLSNATAAVASFRPDRSGQYIIGLTVSNGTYSSSGQVIVSALALQSAGELDPVEIQSVEETGNLEGEACEGLCPNVAIEAKQEGQIMEMDLLRGTSIEVGKSIELDGSSSISPSQHPLHFQWSLLQQPPGSQALLQSPDQVETRFTPDLPGRYRVKLDIQDGSLESSAELSFLAQTQNLEAELPSGETALSSTSTESGGGSGACALQEKGARIPCEWWALSFLVLFLCRFKKNPLGLKPQGDF